MDARQRRTRARLGATVLELAAIEPINDLSVTQVARAAGVNRSTFYDHASSPEDLLRLALLDELDALRAGLLDDTDRDAAEAVDDVTRKVLEHVRRHLAIYRRGLADDAGRGALHGMLTQHFLESSRRLVEQGRLAPPTGVAEVGDVVLSDAARRFVALGTVGLITAWIALPDPQLSQFEAMSDRLLPSWWFPQS